MNTLEAKVSKIESIDGVSIVSFVTLDVELRMMSLGINTPIEVGSEVLLGVKASSIALAKNFHGILSISNQLQCRIDSLEEGSLLWSVKLLFGEFRLESIVTKSSAVQMGLKRGDEVVALIKSSELSILEVKAKG